MIKGFENFTLKLTSEEYQIAAVLAKGFNDMDKGAKYRCNAQYIINRLATRNIKVDEPRLRKIIQYLRSNDLVLGLCSDSGGYWVAANQQEFKATIISLADRIKSHKHTLDCMLRQYRKLYPLSSASKSLL